MLSVQCQPFCSGLNVLTHWVLVASSSQDDPKVLRLHIDNNCIYFAYTDSIVLWVTIKYALKWKELEFVLWISLMPAAKRKPIKRHPRI